MEREEEDKQGAKDGPQLVHVSIRESSWIYSAILLVKMGWVVQTCNLNLKFQFYLTVHFILLFCNIWNIWKEKKPDAPDVLTLLSGPAIAQRPLHLYLYLHLHLYLYLYNHDETHYEEEKSTGKRAI